MINAKVAKTAEPGSAEHHDASGGALELDTNIPYQINRLAFQMNKRLERALRAHNLSIANWRVMAVLNFNTTATVNELSDYAMIEQSTLSRMLQRMEKDGLLRICPSQEDGRVRKIELTKAGQDKLNALRALTSEHTGLILEGLSAREKKALLTTIRKLQSNIA